MTKKTYGFMKNKTNDNENDNGNDDDDSTIISLIISECEKLGVYFDEERAKSILDSDIHIEWFKSSPSFFEFCKESVNLSYPNKNNIEKRNLIFNAICKWKNLRLEYPIWKKNQETEETERKKRETILSAKKNKPIVCKCGEKLNTSLFCLNCRGFYEFNTETLIYEYKQGLGEGDSLAKELKKLMGGKNNNSPEKGE